jgi:hypothetical protein
MVSGKSTHTTRLTDGDFIMSPSLTNLFEAAHGNGILLLEDGATNGGNRNTPASLSGAVAANGTNGLNIKAGYAVIDGMVVDFGGYTVGVNANTYSLTLQQSTIEGTNTALTDSGDAVLLVVYVCTNGSSGAKNIHVEMGTKVTSGFPVTPETFLSDPSGLNSGLTLNSKQSTVLAVVKCVYNSSGGDLNLQVDTIYDMRTFIRQSPIYMTPMTKDTIGTYTNRITSASGLDGMHGGSDEAGALTNSDNPLGALWMSNNENSESVLYFSGKQSSSRNTWRLGPDNLVTATTTQTFKVDTGNYFIMTPGGSGVELNPVGTFPKSHVITVLNLSGSNTVLFNESPDGNSGTAKFTLATNKSAIFAYDGNNTWRQAFVSGNVSGAASGVVSSVQISDGAGNHTSDADLVFLKGEITGVLINNGGGYSAATTSAMTVDTVDATTKISVGDVLRRTNNAGDVIGTVTAVTSTSITIGAGTLATVNDDDPIYREGRLSVDGVVDISKPIFGPTGMEFTPVGKNPYKTTAANSLWRNSADSNRLYSGGTKILLDGDSVGATTILGLTDTPANFTSAANKFLQVNGAGNAVIFDTIAEGDLPTALPSVASIGQSGVGAAGVLTVNKDLTVTGDLIVSGTTTTINVDTVNVEDINLTLGSGVGADADVTGGGITLASTDGAHTILYESSDDSWRFSDHVLPTTDTAKNLGTSSVKWGTIHVGAVSTGTYAGTGNLSIPADASVLKVDASNSRVGVKQATPVSTFQYEQVGHGYIEGTSGTGSDAAVVHTLFATTAFRVAEVLISIEQTTDSDYEVHKAILVHDGSNVEFTVHDKLRTDSGAAFCTTAAAIGSGNVQISITPGVGSKAYTFRIAWKGIAKV